MANRLSVITTRTGDDGTTGLGDGSRTPKDAPRIAALGDVDELNSVIGLLLTEALPDTIAADLLTIQHDLFDMGAELCIPGHTALTDAHIANLDARLAHYNGSLPPCASSFCLVAHVAPRRRMWRARSADGRNAPWWHWRMPTA